MLNQSIKTIKQQCRAMSSEALPYHWLEGWLMSVLDKDKLFLMMHDDYVLTADEYDRFMQGVTRMRSGVPLAYLVGEQDFFGRTFKVNPSTLIPRPDTERLIEVVLDWLSVQAIDSPSILDLGTGSGCIAITLAKELPASNVLAVDMSADALAVAIQNGQRLAADNCRCVQSDWFDAVCGEFDVIVSNPPYIDKADEHLNALHHEPMTALVADDMGLSDIMTIISGSVEYLKLGGLIAIEHGYDQGQSVRELFAQQGFDDVQTIKDYGGNDRLTMGVWHG